MEIAAYAIQCRSYCHCVHTQQLKRFWVSESTSILNGSIGLEDEQNGGNQLTSPPVSAHTHARASNCKRGVGLYAHAPIYVRIDTPSSSLLSLTHTFMRSYSASHARVTSSRAIQPHPAGAARTETRRRSLSEPSYTAYVYVHREHSA